MGLVHNPNVVSDGLVCCWDAANKRSYPGAGTTWTDLVGRQNGTMQNNTSFNSAKGGVLEFDGTDDYVSVPDSDYLDSITSAITVSVWVYWSSDANDISTIVSKASAAGWASPYSSWNMRLRHGTGGWGTETVEFWAAGSYTTGGQFYSSSSIPRDTWTHIVGTYDGANQKIYINGVLDATDAQTAAIATTAQPLLFGTNYGGPGSELLEGSLANVLIYNRGLTAAEVKQNYEALKPRFAPRITKSGLVGNWDAGDPESYSGGSTWKDTANGVVGICYNDTSVANAAFSNNNGGYIEFDGTDDYVVVSDVSHLDLRDKLTMSCWAWFDGDGGGSNTIVFGKEKSGSAQYSMVRMNSGDTLDVGLHTGGWTDFFTSTVLSDDTWYHLSATYDRSNVKIYVNGSLVDTTAETDAISGDSQRFVIGGLDWQNNSTVPDHPMNGRVAIVRMYNKALSAAEIMDNYNKTKARFGH